MKEPDIQKQIKKAQKKRDNSLAQYKDVLITKAEYENELARIAHHYDEWMKRNE